MKRYQLLALLFFLTSLVSAQDQPDREVRLGIDVSKIVYPLVTKTHPFPVKRMYHIEPVVLIELNRPHRFLNLTAGYTVIDSGDIQRNIRLNTRGFYLKAGKEYQHKAVSGGWAVVFSNWRSEGSYRFKGAYFGDYTGVIEPFQQIALGPDYYVATNYSLGSRLVLRLLGRVSMMLPLTTNSPIETEYIPGAGLVSRTLIKVGGGFSVQLMYRIYHSKASYRTES